MPNTDRIYTLLEIANKNFANNENIQNELLVELKELISGESFIGMAQINPIAGNLEYNAKKIAKYIRFAESVGLETVIFPELSLVGYPIYDTIDRHPIIADENIKWLKGLAKLSGNTIALVGFVEPRYYNNNNIKQTGKKFYNSVAILQHGKIQGIVRKSLLPTYSEFNDYRYIESSSAIGLQPAELLGTGECIKNSTKLYNGYGISICEDCWNNSDFFETQPYNTNPIEELFKEKPKLFINCSASPTTGEKERLKHNLLSYISQKHQTPFVYVNQVGATDNISFEGTSSVYDENGNLIARAKSFEEQFLIVNPTKKIGKIYPITKGLEEPLKEQKTFTLEYESDLERIYKTIIQGIRDYFSKCGLKRAVLGLSGGLDSTICAVLLTDALGKENVLGVSMPSNITTKESKTDAETLAQNLGINYAEAPIKEITDITKKCLNTLFSTIETKWNCRYKESFTNDNIQARSRAMFLWGISNEFSSCIPIATSDKSEAYMGYATINGDMSGGFAPIADISKTKLFAFAKWLNKNRAEKNAIPESIIKKKPGAELAIDPKTGKPLIAEDALMPYEFLDEIIWRIENKHENYNDFIDTEFVYEKHHNVSKEQKISWLDKFYSRMSRALYKWTIMPPSVILEKNSINGSIYKQPITSATINYKKVTEQYIESVLAD